MNNNETIEKSIEFIENNLIERISLEDLAKRTFLSKYHYHRVFHELVGETVMEYVRKRRLTEAAKELVETNAKIVDVALKYQFSSQEAFSRAFKRMFKVSPGEFRKAKVNVLLYRRAELYYKNTTIQPRVSPICKAA
ncbi:helix-turn-helix transcriptional regulator [Clostridium sp.]|uniref:helix-turn-helix transcriptional regulator n=1 Tax=Clostridium sp. TaxID=1506 RepID=UPI002FCAF2CC